MASMEFTSCRAVHTGRSATLADNLEIVRRVVEALGFRDRADFHWVADENGFESLAGNFDAIWAIGSLHHAPFELARIQSLALLRRLRAGGRWIELTYPYERWLREGAEPFTEFGKRTDGERTPWAEWYDLQKVKQRLFPARTATILDFTFGGGTSAGSTFASRTQGCRSTLRSRHGASA
jgi:hypothetical protein